MIKLAQHDTKVLLAVHGWSGIVLGLLLYVVICTGVAAVFAEEISDWSSPLSHSYGPAAFPAGLDEVVNRLAAEVDPQYLEEIAIYRSAGGRINMLYHRHDTAPNGEPSERGVEYELDPANWQVLAKREGWSDEIAAQNKAGGIADFLINLHVRLHIPDPYGLLLTGLLGLAMMVAAVTALLIHRHLIADLFTMRLGRDVLLRKRDLHVVAGSWNLPFAFILAFTGCFFSLASTLGLPAIAMVSFGGDQEALIDTLYGTARPENKTPAPLASVEAMLADTRQRNKAEPGFVSVEHFGRTDATVSVSTELPENELVYSSFVYDGTSGKLMQEKPPLGKVSSFGSSVVGLMYPLHFGNFAGAASKAVWVALGFAAAYVTLTGMLLWTRRREEQIAWRRMARAVHWVGYGLPLALICAPYAFFVLRDSGYQVGLIQDIAFLVAAAITGAAVIGIADPEKFRRVVLFCTGIGLTGLPLARLATGGLRWMEALRLGISAVPAMDVALMVLGCSCLWAARLKHPKAAAAAHDLATVRREAQTT